MEHWNSGYYEDELSGTEEEKILEFVSKDALIFLIDASNSMLEVKDRVDEIIPFKSALKCAHSTLKRKIWESSKDVVGVVLYGTKGRVDSFDNMQILIPLGPPEPDGILKLEDIIEGRIRLTPSSEYSLVNALWQCQSMFNDIKGRNVSKKVILLTNEDDPLKKDPAKGKQFYKKVEDFANTGISLELVPVLSSYAKKSTFDFSRFYSDILSLYGNEDERSLEVSKTFQDLLKVVRKKVHKKRSIGKIIFDLGGGVLIATTSYNLIGKAYRPSKVRLTKDTNEEVKIQRNYLNPRTGDPLLPSDIHKFQSYGGEIIKFTQDEVKQISKVDSLGLKLIGFKRKDSLRWSNFVRPGVFVYPDEKSISGSRKLFAALVMRCLARDLIPICFYKPREAFGPSFVALIPQAEVLDDDDHAFQEKPPGFHLVYLPFADDLRSFPETSDFVSVVGPEQLYTAKKLIKKLRLKTYNPEAFENPDLQSRYCLIESLALNREGVEPPEDLTVPQFDKMKDKLGPVAQEFIDAVYPAVYDPSSTTTKRKVSLEPKKSKKKPKLDLIGFDMDSYVTEKKVHKLTVEVLKKFLASVHIPVVDKKKKADLVKAVYAYYDDNGDKEK